MFSFLIAHFIASPVDQLIRSERFYLEVNRVYPVCLYSD